MKSLLLSGRRLGGRAWRKVRRLSGLGMPKLQRFEVFDTFEREGLPSVPLWLGYRNRIKKRWKKIYWPVAVLYDLQKRVNLPEPLVDLLRELDDARTLPRPLPEIAAPVEALARKHPAIIRWSDRFDASAGTRVFAVLPKDDDMAEMCQSIRSSMEGMLGELSRRGLAREGGRALEIGCATGYRTIAVATCGLRETIGIDLDLESSHGFDLAQRPWVEAWFDLHYPNSRGTSRLRQGDAQSLDFPDDYFDLIHSASVLEHVAGLESMFRETYRVLRPGGFAYHEIDPWFSPQGGHSLCTLDFPWGHVRLPETEFEAYIRRFRPHEYDHAMDYYRNEFQRPRMTVHRICALAEKAGFTVLDKTRFDTAYLDHALLVNRGLVRECRTPWPELTSRDLLTHYFRMILGKS